MEVFDTDVFELPAGTLSANQRRGKTLETRPLPEEEGKSFSPDSAASPILLSEDLNLYFLSRCQLREQAMASPIAAPLLETPVWFAAAGASGRRKAKTTERERERGRAREIRQRQWRERQRGQVLMLTLAG